jgi:hypothetical protein
MTTTEQLRDLHISILKAIDKAELLKDNPEFEEGTFQRDYIFKLVHELECAIYNPLYNILDYMELKYEPIEKEDML